MDTQGNEPGERIIEGHVYKVTQIVPVCLSAIAVLRLTFFPFNINYYACNYCSVLGESFTEMEI